MISVAYYNLLYVHEIDETPTGNFFVKETILESIQLCIF